MTYTDLSSTMGGSRKEIIDHTEEEIRSESMKGDGYRSPVFDGMPHAHNPTAGEDRIIKKLDTINLLEERYRDAIEYMKWYKPAWEALTNDERFVLETFYREENGYGSNAIFAIMQHFGIEQTSAYKRKNRALDHFSLLLFGKS